MLSNVFKAQCSVQLMLFLIKKRLLVVAVDFDHLRPV